MVAHTGYLVFARPVSTPPDFELGAAADEESLPSDG
jgi:hypothetical protein